MDTRMTVATAIRKAYAADAAGGNDDLCGDADEWLAEADAAIAAAADDVLVAENRALRLLLAQAKPFIAHNGLLLRIGALGIEADPRYKAIAAEAHGA